MVASSFFGRSKSLVIIFIWFFAANSSSSKSVLDRENKATSAPEINAEPIKRTIKSANPSTIFILVLAISKIKHEGSGSI